MKWRAISARPYQARPHVLRRELQDANRLPSLPVPIPLHAGRLVVVIVLQLGRDLEPLEAQVRRRRVRRVTAPPDRVCCTTLTLTTSYDGI